MGERLTALETWQAALGIELRGMKTAINGLTAGAWAVVLSVLGFLAIQVYAGLKPAAPQPQGYAQYQQSSPWPPQAQAEQPPPAPPLAQPHRR